MQNMARSLKLGKSVGDVGWGMFSRMLEYKSLWQGKHLVKVSKCFPSSKTCHVCGFVNKSLTLKDRDWTCPRCGTFLDRDWNASINIRDEGHRLFLDQTLKGTVGTTETGTLTSTYARGDCIRPMHKQDSACGAMSCSGPAPDVIHFWTRYSTLLLISGMKDIDFFLVKLLKVLSGRQKRKLLIWESTPFTGW